MRRLGWLGMAAGILVAGCGGAETGETADEDAIEARSDALCGRIRMNMNGGPTQYWDAVTACWELGGQATKACAQELCQVYCYIPC